MVHKTSIATLSASVARKTSEPRTPKPTTPPLKKKVLAQFESMSLQNRKQVPITLPTVNWGKPEPSKSRPRRAKESKS